MESLPLTPNGKVDRKALPVPEGSSYVARAYEAPRCSRGDDRADLVRGAQGRAGWASRQLLRTGGHSLMGVRLVERMRRAGLHADSAAVFGAPTLAELAVREQREP